MAVFESIFAKFFDFFNSILTIFGQKNIDRNEAAEGTIKNWWDILTNKGE